MVDVKPEKFAAKPEVAAVFDWTGRLCAAKGWRYEVRSEGPATLLANVRFLAAGRRRELIDVDAVNAEETAAAAGMTIDEVSTAVASLICRSLVRPGSSMPLEVPARIKS